jgi:hypothetical protein
MSNLDSLIALIGDLEEGDRIPPGAIQLAKTIGAAIIFGYSDDGVMVEGIVNDQGSAYDGNTLWLDRQGFLPINEDLTLQDDEPGTIDECRNIVARFDSAVKLRAIWGGSRAAWCYEVCVEHRTFDIKEDSSDYNTPANNVWCRGIVFLLPETPVTA